MADTTLLRHSDVTAAVDDRHWRVLLQSLRATFSTPDFATAAAFVARIAAAADEANHHPDVVLRWGQVTVTTSSHDAGGLTQRDVDLAATVSAIADELGVAGDSPRSGMLEIAVDALDIPAVRPFWAAVFGYDVRERRRPGRPRGHRPVHLVPADGRTPPAAQPDPLRRHRRRTTRREARVAAAVAAGGHLVSDEQAPAFWVLADAEGNEVCVCTWQARRTS